MFVVKVRDAGFSNVGLWADQELSEMNWMDRVYLRYLFLSIKRFVVVDNVNIVKIILSTVNRLLVTV